MEEVGVKQGSGANEISRLGSTRAFFLSLESLMEFPLYVMYRAFESVFRVGEGST